MGAQIEDPGDQSQEGAPRRGGGPPERGLHHFKAPDGATYVLYIYLGSTYSAHLPPFDSDFDFVESLPNCLGELSVVVLHVAQIG